MSGVPAVVAGDRLLRRFHGLATAARDRGLSRRVLEDRDFTDPAHVTLDGERLLNFTSCGYLGLNTDERLKAGAIDAIQRYGTSYSSSPAYSALPLYEELTHRLSAMMGGAAVVLTPSTTLAHLAALPLLIRPGDSIVMDAYCHASVQTALERTSKVPVTTVRHADAGELDNAIGAAAASTTGRVWYLADGVYSMHGDLAPMDQIHRLLDQHPSLHVYIDDAHGFSWQGRSGRGVALDAGGWHARLVVAVGLSKSFAATGGALAAGDPELVDLVELCGGPLSFGGPIPPAALGAGIASADIHLSDEHDRLNHELLRRFSFVDQMAGHLGIPFSSTPVSPIRYVEIGSTETMFSVIDGMKDDGFYLNGAMFPIVPHGHAGVRFTIGLSVSESQTEAMLHHLARRLPESAGGGSAIDLTGDGVRIRIMP